MGVHKDSVMRASTQDSGGTRIKIVGGQIRFVIYNFSLEKKLFIFFSSFPLLKTNTHNSRIQKKYYYHSLLYHAIIS